MRYLLAVALVSILASCGVREQVTEVRELALATAPTEPQNWVSDPVLLDQCRSAASRSPYRKRKTIGEFEIVPAISEGFVLEVASLFRDVPDRVEAVHDLAIYHIDIAVAWPVPEQGYSCVVHRSSEGDAKVLGFVNSRRAGRTSLKATAFEPLVKAICESAGLGTRLWLNSSICAAK